MKADKAAKISFGNKRVSRHLLVKPFFRPNLFCFFFPEIPRTLINYQVRKTYSSQPAKLFRKHTYNICIDVIQKACTTNNCIDSISDESLKYFFLSDPIGNHSFLESTASTASRATKHLLILLTGMYIRNFQIQSCLSSMASTTFGGGSC